MEPAEHGRPGKTASTMEFSRRTFIRAVAGGLTAGAAAPALVVVLAACGGAAPASGTASVTGPNIPAGAQTSAPSVAQGSTSAAASGGTAKANPFPTFIPVQGGPKPDFPSAGQ